MRRVVGITLFFVAFMSTGNQAQATKFLSPGQPGFRADSIYHDDVFVFGNKVRFDGRVRGDLFSFTNEMVQTDSVLGSFNACGNNIQVLAPVRGSFRAFGNVVSCNDEIGRNLLFFGNKITIGPQAKIGHDADLGCSSVVLNGRVDGDLKIGAGQAVIGGTVGGDLEFEGGSLTLKPGAVIKGNLRYTTPEEAVIPQQAQVGGEVKWTMSEQEEKGKTRFGVARFLAWVVSLKGYLLFSTIVALVSFIIAVIPFPAWLNAIFLCITLAISGNILILLTKNKALATEEILNRRFLPSIGLGFAILFLGPLVSGALLLTLVAAPLGMLSLVMYGVAAFAGAIYVSLFAGRKLFMIFSREAEKTTGYLCFTVGMVILVALSFIPVFGYLLTLLVTMTGLGALALTFLGEKAKTEVAP